MRSLKRRKAGGGGATSGEEYEALRTRSRSMEHILQPAGEQRMGSGMDNPNYWVQPYSRSRSLPRHLERGERWEEEAAWEGGSQKRRASREDLGRTWREEPAWSSGRGEEQLHRSWREELEERSARAEMERSWKMRRRTAESSRTPQPGRKSSDSSTPDTVQSSLHSLASGKSVTIANTVEIIPRASLANSRSRREGEVSVNNVKIGRGEGLSQGLREVGASQTLGRVGLSLGREVVTNQGKEGVTLGRGVRLGRQEETRFEFSLCVCGCFCRCCKKIANIFPLYLSETSSRTRRPAKYLRQCLPLSIQHCHSGGRIYPLYQVIYDNYMLKYAGLSW